MYYKTRDGTEYNLAFVESFRDISGEMKPRNYWFEEAPDRKTWYGRTIKGRPSGYYSMDWEGYKYPTTEKKARYGNVIRAWFVGRKYNSDCVDFVFDDEKGIREFIKLIKSSKIEGNCNFKAP